MKLPELLAPAGNFAIAEAAFDYGADAVYVGLGQLNLRAHSPNFSVEGLSELIELARTRRKRVFAALNIMPDSRRLKLVEETLVQLQRGDCAPDALIISDPGVLMLCREILPEIQLHLSTQTGSFNERALSFWKEQGISRVVLPREFSLAQIAELNSLGVLETEVFIHGAMCVSISGRCLLGAYLSQRHPNLGDCSQPCRFRYKIASIEPDCKGEGVWLDAEESERGVYLLNSKDLCALEILPEIIASGVSSLKIEGRNKSVHYVASVVKIYREALDSICENSDGYTVTDRWKEELERIEHRPYTSGFYNNELMLQEVFSSKASSSLRFVGIVKGMLPDGVPVIDVKNSFSAGESLQVLPVQRSLSPYQITFSRLFDLSGNELTYAPSNRLITGQGDFRLRVGDMLRRELVS